MLTLFDLLIPTDFARGGGGGSGGSGGGDGGAIIFLVGYVPMHWLGAFLRKFGKNPVASVLQQVVGWCAAIAYSILVIAGSHFIGILVALGALSGMAAGLYNWIGKAKQSKLVKGRLTAAAQADSAWDETKLTEYATATFMRYQTDWSNLDAKATEDYLTPAYQHHSALLLYALQLLSRKNIMTNVQVKQAVITDAQDALDNSKDSFTVTFIADATDQLLDTRSNAILFTDQSTFTEYWQFVRSETTWLLAGIQQASITPAYVRLPEIEQFARTNGYFYSADMGWLLIPASGQFFGKAKFGTSDINNHVIGLYNNQILVQIYSYTPSADTSKTYLLAQMNLPGKTYGQIIVRQKKKLNLFGIRGLEKVSTEWIEFNGKYEVYAASAEQATSFELLNPTFMEQLAAAPFEVNLEVVDNVVYFYSDEREANIANYQAMLQILYAAFKEMRM